MNKDVRALKDALEDPNTRMSTSRRILTGKARINRRKFTLAERIHVENLCSIWISLDTCLLMAGADKVLCHIIMF